MALNGAEDAVEKGWLDYEALLGEANGRFLRQDVDERNLLTINYTNGTTSRPKGVMITHRNAYMNVVGTLIHLPMSPADRYLGRCRCFTPSGWDVHMDGDGGRRGARAACLGSTPRSCST